MVECNIRSTASAADPSNKVVFVVVMFLLLFSFKIWFLAAFFASPDPVDRMWKYLWGLIFRAAA